MKFHGVVAALAAVFVFLAGSTAAFAAPVSACQVKIIGEVKVSNHGGSPVMDGEINGKPAKFLADTGAQDSTLFRGAVAVYGVKSYIVEGVKFYGVGGARQAETATLESMKLGTLSEKNLSLFVLPSNFGELAGALGADFFAQADIEFDLAHDTIRFLRTDGCKGDEALYWASGAYSVLPFVESASSVDKTISVQVLLNGRPARAELDTGASDSVITPQGARLAGVEPKSVTIGNGGLRGLGNAQVQPGIGDFTFTFDQETIKATPILVADLFGADKEVHVGSRFAESVMDEPLMLLGADFFLAHRVLISNAQRKVYITYGGGKVFNTSATER